MQRTELVTIISKKHNIDIATVNTIIVSLFNEIKHVVQSGDEYHHWGFGKFKKSSRKARLIHNVANGELHKLPKKKTLKFIPSRDFNKSLN